MESGVGPTHPKFAGRGRPLREISVRELLPKHGERHYDGNLQAMTKAIPWAELNRIAAWRAGVFGVEFRLPFDLLDDLHHGILVSLAECWNRLRRYTKPGSAACTASHWFGLQWLRRHRYAVHVPRPHRMPRMSAVPVSYSTWGDSYRRALVATEMAHLSVCVQEYARGGAVTAICQHHQISKQTLFRRLVRAEKLLVDRSAV